MLNHGDGPSIFLDIFYVRMTDNEDSLHVVMETFVGKKRAGNVMLKRQILKGQCHNNFSHFLTTSTLKETPK